jgi:hypothetical protein
MIPDVNATIKNLGGSGLLLESQRLFWDSIKARLRSFLAPLPNSEPLSNAVTPVYTSDSPTIFPMYS